MRYIWRLEAPGFFFVRRASPTQRFAPCGVAGSSVPRTFPSVALVPRMLCTIPPRPNSLIRLRKGVRKKFLPLPRRHANIDYVNYPPNPITRSPFHHMQAILAPEAVILSALRTGKKITSPCVCEFGTTAGRVRIPGLAAARQSTALVAFPCLHIWNRVAPQFCRPAVCVLEPRVPASGARDCGGAAAEPVVSAEMLDGE